MALITQERMIGYVHLFKENGLKQLLQIREYFRELLEILKFENFDRFDFANAKRAPEEFFLPDFRNRRIDVLYSLPIREERNKATSPRFNVSILIEHQSEPDRFMSFRASQYDLLIRQRFLTEHITEGGTEATFLFNPVRHVVLYTGLTEWDHIHSIEELTRTSPYWNSAEEQIRAPYIHRIFLPDIPESELRRTDNAFLQILRVL